MFLYLNNNFVCVLRAVPMLGFLVQSPHDEAKVQIAKILKIVFWDEEKCS